MANVKLGTGPNGMEKRSTKYSTVRASEKSSQRISAENVIPQAKSKSRRMRGWMKRHKQERIK
jgi:hypothetical protein